jgi:integrase
MERKLIGANLAALESDFASSGKSDKIYWDTELKGFGLRFRSGGVRTWIFQYKFQGKDRRYKLGPYPEMTAKTARELAQDKRADVWKGKDPQAEKREEKAKAQAKAQAQITLGTVVDNFLADKKPELRPQSYYEIERRLTKDWKSLHGWPIEAIQIPQVATILDRLKKTGPVAAAHSRANLSALFRWAMGHGYVKYNPVIGTINPDNGVPRERVLEDNELAAVWNNSGGDDYGKVIKLLILTGCRKMEVGGMRWSELNVDNRKWIIPSERTKNGRDHTLPLPHAFWEIVESVERRPGRDCLFGYTDRGFRNWSDTKIALDRRCGVQKWTHHDIRRTVATKMAESPPDKEHPESRGLGIKPHVVEAVLNHVSGHKSGVAGIYNHATYLPEVKIALARWAEYVASITSGEERKILQFPAESGVAS